MWCLVKNAGEGQAHGRRTNALECKQKHWKDGRKIWSSVMPSRAKNVIKCRRMPLNWQVISGWVVPLNRPGRENIQEILAIGP